jgi:hypothetical protein
MDLKAAQAVLALPLTSPRSIAKLMLLPPS